MNKFALRIISLFSHVKSGNVREFYVFYSHVKSMQINKISKSHAKVEDVSI